MVQGTASHVGKSVLVAALCRIFRQDGYRVAPFKAQNMSNNSYVTPDGGEIGRAQAVQAEAAGIEPSVEMNPVLLKPEADSRSQIVLLGKPQGSAGGSYFAQVKPRLWHAITTSLDSLRDRYDVVVIEGAGSPAEINLKQHEIVNMRVARYCGAPVLLAGDIDRGGVFASLVGTMELLDPEERECVKGFVVNKFRGDVALLEPGLAFLEERTGVPVAGVIPYYYDIDIPEEDAVPLEERRRMKERTDYLLDIAVVGFPHISNFDDFDPLAREPGVRVRYVEARDELGHPDMVVLPGTKTTVRDLEWMRERGFAHRVRQLAKDGVAVVGICGGYQMLGDRILDPQGIESGEPQTRGLELLPVTTVFEGTKETCRVTGEVTGSSGLLQGAAGTALDGYEIHMGRTATSPGSRRPVGNGPFLLKERSGCPVRHVDGAVDSRGMVLGTYLHGLFYNQGVRASVLMALAERKGVSLPGPEGDAPHSIDAEYDKLAALVRSGLRMDLVYHVTGLGSPPASSR